MSWNESIWPDHNDPPGITTGANIQGEPADATTDILKAKVIPHVVKWVDDFNVIRHPPHFIPYPSGSLIYSYAFGLHAQHHKTSRHPLA